MPWQRPLLGSLLILLVLADLPAHADGIATLESSRGNRLLEMTVRWADDRLRLDFPSRPASYLLRRGDAAYLVTDLNRGRVVISLTNLRRLAKRTRNENLAEHPRPAAELKVLEPMHKQEAVGGIEGEVYRLHWVDGRGEPHEERLVVSDHPLVAELMTGMQAYYRALSDRPDPIISALVKRDLGMLRLTGRFRLLSISGETPDATLFALPDGAKVMEAVEAQGEAGDREEGEDEGEKKDAPTGSPAGPLPGTQGKEPSNG
ncbi:hypothetical protein [Halomonas sp. YLGW01]|uniref:hypothetical protein n=1 Tax=Halomonas sp. YLGW01 TaxID=2773308 RepID=UPI00177F111B|nr:hypothetical protein [Halomonas sp. YLGW01]